MIAVQATKPVAKSGSQGGMRVMLRLTSLTGSDISFAMMSGRTKVSDVLAFTDKAASCYINANYTVGATGVPVFDWSTDQNKFKDLHAYDGSRAAAGVERPAIVVLDFICDGAVHAGDFATLQIKLYYRVNGRWLPADYVFENLQVDAGR